METNQCNQCLGGGWNQCRRAGGDRAPEILHVSLARFKWSLSDAEKVKEMPEGQKVVSGETDGEDDRLDCGGLRPSTKMRWVASPLLRIVSVSIT